MLLELSLRNFAIIDELSVRFGEGLNIITGETGTGKSILVNALNLLLGARGSAELIKTGADEACVEALFSLERNPGVRERLRAEGIECADDALVVRRVVSGRGRGRAYINGNIATSAMLSYITGGLVDIFSQQEHQSLLREESHLGVIDQFAGNEELLARLRERHRRWVGLRGELRGLRERRKAGGEREDYLRFLVSEIDRVNPQTGEDGRLEEERRILSNARYLRETAERAYDALYEAGGSVLDGLRATLRELAGARECDPSLEEMTTALEGALHEIEEASYGLRDYASRVVVDGERLEAVEERLEEIARLKRKHSASIEDILKKRDEIERELVGILDYDDRVEELEGEIGRSLAELEAVAGELGRRRRRAAAGLEEKVNAELAKVGLGSADFRVSFQESALSPSGAERVAFLFTANPDQEHRPLVRVASGGELSRTMLVLKETLASVEGSSVLIFDEADSGIGGAVAETVGRKIKGLSERCQVISITHLPQVAKFADSHLLVTKEVSGQRTSVRVSELSPGERVSELARMLGGLSVTEKTLEAAREMLEL